jgi:3-hydroxyacyl-CoA dehydrogenase
MIPLVEVVAGAKTSPETVQRALAFYRSIGKKAIHVRKEMVGHVANRIQGALYREVVYLIEQGVLDVPDADAAVCWGPGLRWGVMGPNLLFHLGGGQGGIEHFMDHLSGPVSTWWKDLGRITEFTPQIRQTIIDGVLKEAGGWNGNATPCYWNCLPRAQKLKFHPEEKFNDCNQTLVGRTDRCRHVHNARRCSREIPSPAKPRNERQCVVQRPLGSQQCPHSNTERR